MKIAIGNDHIAYEMKLYIVKYLSEAGHEVVNFGTDSIERTDYPIYAQRVASSVIKGECESGILICGTGVGISIAANKVAGIRSVVCSEPYSAKLAREHNNANILAFGARVIGLATAEMIVDTFIKSEYEGGRHQKRIDMIAEIEHRRR